MISASASDNRSSERLSLIDRRTVETSAKGNYRPLAASPSPSCSRRLSGSARSVHFEAANTRLKAYLYGGSRSEVPTLPTARPSSPRPTLSKDALLVQAVKNELAKRGLRCDLFPVLRSQAGWERARFEAALVELTGNNHPVGCN